MAQAAPQPSPPPLTRKQLHELRQWQRRMVTVFLLSTISLLAVMGIGLIFNLGEVVGGILLAGLVAVVVVAVRIQFSQACPACGARLGLQTRLWLPAQCKRCGVALKERSGG